MTSQGLVTARHSEEDVQDACERFVGWLERRLLVAGRGDELDQLTVDPSGLFWLGRLAPELSVLELGLGERGERLDPCEVGFRLRPRHSAPWNFAVVVVLRCWVRESGANWIKSDQVQVEVPISVSESSEGIHTYGEEDLAAGIHAVAPDVPRAAAVRLEVELGLDGTPELTLTLVNTTDTDTGRGSRNQPRPDLNLYEVSLRLKGLPTNPFQLEALPDSFRYNRRVLAYGINCGVREQDGDLLTVDAPVVDRRRPTYWYEGGAPPDLSFDGLSSDPIPRLRDLVEQLQRWGHENWGDEALIERSQVNDWSAEMLAEARSQADLFHREAARIADGVSLLEADDDLKRAFTLMNRAMVHSANGKYSGWRGFQIGFLLANLSSLVEPDRDAEVADIVWFATGGGKTETYLGLLVTAALHDRMTGKTSGLTAWSRFPLRMLSLQQTQRFADAMAGAEIQRQKAGLGGDPFSVGFLVGMGATPNSIKPDPKAGEPDPEDDEMPQRYQVLLRCPFCHVDQIEMAFNRRYWRLEHRCLNPECPWPEAALPFYVVDEEIYRFLPTIVVGTLDKAASIALQAAMRAFVGAPHAKCSEEGHGYAYAPRSTRPNGCLVPGCRGSAGALNMDRTRFAPSFRLQDELHLLRDSLGAVDAHYEALIDDLQQQLTGKRAKILASSATLSGYEKQVDVLYQRSGRVFPLQGPSSESGFWTTDTSRLARKFVAIAPRGVTLEFTVDRMVTQLQNEVRRLLYEPEMVCEDAGVDPSFVPALLSLYGTDVVYGNSLRDLEAATRSLETQVPVVPPSLVTAQLTGRTDFEEVRQTLDRLENPEEAFEDRVHVIAASSMMSHGVDIDRLNAMVVLGVPLTTAEFIQTTARVGRRYPSLVFLVHKIARERDASVYRSFEHFVLQGDRFVEPVPVTRRSRRVLERTVAGLELARVLTLHEPRSSIALSTVKNLRQYFKDAELTEEDEFAALVRTLGISDDLDEPMRNDLNRWVEAFFANLMDPAGSGRFPSDLCPWGGPMISLRDVEEQAPVRD